jgi:hypothetical protein
MLAILLIAALPLVAITIVWPTYGSACALSSPCWSRWCR